MRGGQRESRTGRTEISPRTAHRTVAEGEAAVADSGEAGMLGREGSAADGYGCNPKSQESWSSAERPGPLAGF